MTDLASQLLALAEADQDLADRLAKRAAMLRAAARALMEAEPGPAPAAPRPPARHRQDQQSLMPFLAAE